MEVVKDICDRMAVMEAGKVVEEGPVYDMFANPKQELTKNFVNSILQFELPNHLLEERKGKIIKVTFQGAIAEEGIISDAFQHYQVKGNILHGKIEYIQNNPLGIFIMELTGEENEIVKAIQYIKDRTKNVEVIYHAS